jgi:hypothetical protein
MALGLLFILGGVLIAWLALAMSTYLLTQVEHFRVHPTMAIALYFADLMTFFLVVVGFIFVLSSLVG